eukprot:1157570-Pelagomonas_calceolata.AAC.13
MAQKLHPCNLCTGGISSSFMHTSNSSKKVASSSSSNSNGTSASHNPWPKGELPKTFEAASAEPRIYKWWVENSNSMRLASSSGRSDKPCPPPALCLANCEDAHAVPTCVCPLLDKTVLPLNCPACSAGIKSTGLYTRPCYHPASHGADLIRLLCGQSSKNGQDDVSKACLTHCCADACMHRWESGGYFRPQENAQGPPYTIPMPPPNVTGKLHMGHAMFATIQGRHVRATAHEAYCFATIQVCVQEVAGGCITGAAEANMWDAYVILQRGLSGA